MVSGLHRRSGEAAAFLISNVPLFRTDEMTKLMLSMMSYEHAQREETIEKESSFLQMYSVFCVLEESLCPEGVNSLGAKKHAKKGRSKITHATVEVGASKC